MPQRPRLGKADAVAPSYVQVTPETRRLILAVQGHDTAPELCVRRVLNPIGYRFRLHRKDLPGTPDIALPRFRKIVFVQGCFCNGHEDCKRATRPVNNTSTWVTKIEGNRTRDQRTLEELCASGWAVLVVWECEVRDAPRLETWLRDFLKR